MAIRNWQVVSKKVYRKKKRVLSMTKTALILRNKYNYMEKEEVQTKCWKCGKFVKTHHYFGEGGGEYLSYTCKCGGKGDEPFY